MILASLGFGNPFKKYKGGIMYNQGVSCNRLNLSAPLYQNISPNYFTVFANLEILNPFLFASATNLSFAPLQFRHEGFMFFGSM